MGIRCFLVVPIFDVAGTRKPAPGEGERWAPLDQAILSWRRPDTGEQFDFPYQAGFGAMWQAIWMPKNADWENETEAHLVVSTPGGHWDIDQRCSNCQEPRDRLHRCWVRHGEPPNVTVDKNGVTCGAGAGSFLTAGWHGFLRNGELTT